MKTLLVTSSLPWPLENYGSAQRSGLLLKSLKELGDVGVVVARSSSQRKGPPLGDATIKNIWQMEYNDQREAGIFRLAQPFLKKELTPMARKFALCKGDYSVSDPDCMVYLKRIIKEFSPDLIVCRYLRPAVATGAVFVTEIPVILDFDDMDWKVSRSFDQSRVGNTLITFLQNKIYRSYLEKNGRKYLKNFAHIWVTSKEDQQELAQPNSSLLPNIPVEAPGKLLASKERSILFVGNLEYSPNAEGLNHFLEQIWPQVQEAAPEVVFRIVGKISSEQALKWRNLSQVEVVGESNDMKSEYERALFTVAPIYWGGGTKIKVLESLAFQRPCVVTPHALYGLGDHLKHNKNIWCGKNDKEFAVGCLRFLHSKDLCKNMAIQGYNVIKKHYSYTNFNSVVKKTVSDVIQHP